METDQYLFPISLHKFPTCSYYKICFHRLLKYSFSFISCCRHPYLLETMPQQHILIHLRRGMAFPALFQFWHKLFLFFKCQCKEGFLCLLTVLQPGHNFFFCSHITSHTSIYCLFCCTGQKSLGLT